MRILAKKLQNEDKKKEVRRSMRNTETAKSAKESQVADSTYPNENSEAMRTRHSERLRSLKSGNDRTKSAKKKSSNPKKRAAPKQ